MLEATGVCNGIENYSRHMEGRAAGEPPYTLLNYFPEDFVVFVDDRTKLDRQRQHLTRQWRQNVFCHTALSPRVVRWHQANEPDRPRYSNIVRKMPAAMTVPITPARFGPMANINK